MASITSTPVHITYRLSGSIPEKKLLTLQEKRDRALQELEANKDEELSPQSVKAYNLKRKAILTKYQQGVDRLLDRAKTGPFHLQQQPVRDIIIKSWKNLRDRGIVDVLAVCVMGNHVHTILKAPEDVNSVSPAPLMELHQDYTALKARQLLGVEFPDFWEASYQGQKIRSGNFANAVREVLNNPVKAGLVDNWADWPGTFVSEEYVEMFE